MKNEIVKSNEKYFAQLKYEKAIEEKYFEKEKLISGFCRPLEVIKTVLEFTEVKKGA